MAGGKKGGGRRKRMGNPFKKTSKKQITKSNYNANTYKTTCHWIADVAPKQGLLLTNYLYFDACAHGTAAAIEKTAEHTLYRKIFDQYRITGVKMTWKPKVNVASASEVAGGALNDFQGVVYSSYDVDSEIPSSIINLQTRRSTRQHRIFKAFSRTFKYKYPNGMWLDTNVDYTTNPSTPRELGWLAHFGIYGEDLPELSGAITDKALGTVEITYSVVYRGQTITNAGYDADKDIVVLGNNEVPSKAQSDIVPHSGYQSVTVTGLANLNAAT